MSASSAGHGTTAALGQKNVALRALLLARKVQRRKAQLRIHDVALRIKDASMPASRN
jgi:hypothetical protein